MKQLCNSCDYMAENKQKGTICLNPKSDNFNQKVISDDGCNFIETYFYVNPQMEDEKGLLD